MPADRDVEYDPVGGTVLCGAAGTDQPDVLGDAGLVPGPVAVSMMEMVEQALDTTKINWQALGVDPKIIVENSERVKGRFIPSETTTDEPCAVVAYGPSLAETWADVAHFNKIFSCSGSHRFLVEKGIVPTHHCESDPRGHKVAMLGNPNRDTEYLVASCIHSNYLDHLEAAGAKIKLWHLLFDEDELYALYPKGDWIICGGNTIGPRTIKLARLSGFTNIHVFGLDGSGRHAGAHTNAPPADWYNPVTIAGRTFQTTQNLLMQAKVLFDDLDRMHEVKVTFHGDGLYQHMAKTRTPRDLPRWPLAIQK